MSDDFHKIVKLIQFGLRLRLIIPNVLCSYSRDEKILLKLNLQQGQILVEIEFHGIFYHRGLPTLFMVL